MRRIGFVTLVGLFFTLNGGPVSGDTPVVSSNLAVTAPSSGTTVGSESNAVPNRFDAAGANDRAVLWDQYANYSDVDSAAQDFEATYDSYDIFAADDFVNPEPWQITTIVVRGGWGGYVDLSNATAIHWAIYADASGEPAGLPGDGNEFWTLSLPPTDPQVQLGVVDAEDVVLTLSTPMPELPAGNWWLVYWVSLEYGSYGQYGWSNTSDTVVGSAGMQNNPGGGFGMGTGWWANSSGADFMFRLEGDTVPVELQFFTVE